jgi:hypothetical protein
MTGGFGYWRKISGPEREYERKRWVDEKLCRDSEEPESFRAWGPWELGNLARDSESAQRLNHWDEANDLAYYAVRLRAELLAIDGPLSPPRAEIANARNP